MVEHEQDRKRLRASGRYGVTETGDMPKSLRYCAASCRGEVVLRVDEVAVVGGAAVFPVVDVVAVGPSDGAVAAWESAAAVAGGDLSEQRAGDAVGGASEGFGGTVGVADDDVDLAVAQVGLGAGRCDGSASVIVRLSSVVCRLSSFVVRRSSFVARGALVVRVVMSAEMLMLGRCRGVPSPSSSTASASLRHFATATCVSA